MATLRQTIHDITKRHLEQNHGLIMGQCLSAVGWVNGTVPDTKNIVELPMTDVAGADIAVGAAITGRRPILVIRFQDFLLLNGNALIVFAAKRKEVFQRSVPLFVRALAKEGNGTGNSHSGKLHSTFMHFPGLRLWAPVTPQDYKDAWSDFMAHDDPVICFEHRATFDNDKEFVKYTGEAEVTIYAISLARQSAVIAAQMLTDGGLPCKVEHVVQLRPLKFNMPDTQKNLVVDTGYETCGAARDIAYQIMERTGKYAKALGIEDKAVGCRLDAENLTPSPERIIEEVWNFLA